MTKGAAFACALGGSELQQRLDEIAELGASSLIEHKTDGDRHLLTFRANEETRRRLEAIVAAEVQCCPFLDLALEDRSGAIVLSIGAPGEGQAVAGQLTAAFAGRKDSR